MKQPVKTAEIIKPFGDYQTPGPNKRVIATLRDILDGAERGEILAVAVAMIKAGGIVHIRGESGNRGMAELVGAVSVLQHDMLQDWKNHTDDTG